MSDNDGPRRWPIWLWPNLLSLDAPVVAVIWQTFLAWCARINLHPASQAVLLLTVWVVYLGDRLLDVRYPPGSDEPPRHQFYRRNRGAAIAMLVGGLALDAAICLTWLRPAIFDSGLFVLACVFAYFGLVHFRKAGLRNLLPKEAAVALLFTIGTVLAPWTNSARSMQLLPLPAFLFFLLCLANCVGIEYWEWTDVRGQKPPAPHPATCWLGQHFEVLMVLLLAVTVWLSYQTVGEAQVRFFYYAASASAAGLLFVSLARRNLKTDLTRVLADMVLLSPLLVQLAYRI